MGGKADAPSAPDYMNIARQQGQLNKEAAAYNTYANRVNQFTPWGSSTFTPQQVRDPATGQMVTQWTQNQTLTPELQARLDNEFAVNRGRSDVAAGMMGQLDELGQPMDYSQFRQVTDVTDPNVNRQRAEDAAYQRATSRLDPRFEQEQQSLDIQLRNRGLRPGDEAYDTAMGNFDRARTDAYQQAQDASVQQGRQEAAQSFDQMMSQQRQSRDLRSLEIAEEMKRRGYPLEVINSLMGGAVQGPNVGTSYGAAGSAAPVNLMGAAQNQYSADIDRFNVEQANQQSLWNTIGGIGQIGLGFMCDRRLKRKISYIGSVNGVKFYSFQYIWGAWSVGPMADEVAEHAVYTHPSGAKMVDLGAL